MDTNKSKSVVYSLFSIPLMICEEKYNFNESVLEYIQNLKSNYTTGNKNKRTVDSNILESFELSTLKQFCLKWINFYAHEFLSITDSTKFYITQSWCNYADKGDSHVAHMHSNSLISGVFYIQGENTPIVFHRKENMFPLAFNYKTYDLNNCEAYGVDMEVGKLFLFPSTLRHSVFENDTNTERISLSFNTFATGEFGMEVNSNWLKLN